MRLYKDILLMDRIRT